MLFEISFGNLKKKFCVLISISSKTWYGWNYESYSHTSLVVKYNIFIHTQSPPTYSNPKCRGKNKDVHTILAMKRDSS